MQIGMIGLGRMGANMVLRLLRAGHECIVHDINPKAIEALVKEGATGAYSFEEFIDKLKPPRAAWLMLPASITNANVRNLAAMMKKGDLIVDGGNSNYRDAVDLGEELAAEGIDFIDVGTSGGVWGLERGYSLMVGGPKKAFERLEPALATLSPANAKATAKPKRTDTAPLGYLHCGPSGAGHFVKMVHNGIEYGLMAAYAEGLNILRNANDGAEDRAADAETAPLPEAKYYRFDLDLPAVTEVWRHGSVIGSWLLDLTAQELKDDPELKGFSGRVSDSGEGRWTLKAAVDTGVPAPVLAAALFDRFSSRGESEFADKVLSAMRYAFGGHVEKRKG